MSETIIEAIEALERLPQERKEQALNAMKFIEVGYQMGKADAEAGKEKTT